MDVGGSWRDKRAGERPPTATASFRGGSRNASGGGRGTSSSMETRGSRTVHQNGGNQQTEGRNRVVQPPPSIGGTQSLRAGPPKVSDLNPNAAAFMEPKLNGPLLILDINGVLLRRDGYEKGRQRKYKMRPFAYEFLDWAFQNFSCALWSCGKKETLEMEVFDKYRSRLLFVRSQDDSTNLWPRRSQVSQEKPLFLKELGRLWRQDPRFTSENTILLDNHSEKFERNPPGTCVLVPDYEGDEQDNVLSLQGELVKHLTVMREASSLAEYAQTQLDSYYFSFLKNTPPPESLPGQDPISLRRSLATLFTSSTVMRTLSPERDVEFYMNHRDTPGPRAIPFSRKDVKRLSRVHLDWSVCEKTDGVRLLFFVPPHGEEAKLSSNSETEQEEMIGYFVDRSWNFTRVVLASNQVFSQGNGGRKGGILIDGEMVTHNLAQPIFLIFDVVFLFGEDVGSLPTLSKRITKLRDLGDLSSVTFSYGEYSKARFALKNFLPLSQIGQIDPAKAVFESYDAEIPCDGLVFTPNNSYYQTTVLKFKPSDRLTVDFLLVGTTSEWTESAALRLNDYIKEGRAGQYSEFNIVGELIVDERTRTKLKQHEQSRNRGGGNRGSRHGVSSFARIVECGFDRKEGAWRLVGIREDKMKPNSLSTAWKCLESVAENLTHEELVEVFTRLPQDPNGDQEDTAQSHYDARQNYRNEAKELDARIAVLRRMNNYVKSELIGTAGFRHFPLPSNGSSECPVLPPALASPSKQHNQQRHNRRKGGGSGKPAKQQPVTVLDIACGRGGDLIKWFKQYNIQLYVGTDISPEALKEAKRRVDEMKVSDRGVCFVADAGSKDFPERLKTELVAAGKSQDVNFDLISIQFALHYFCDTRESCERFFSYLHSFSHAGSRVLVTMLDPLIVEQKLREGGGRFEIDICKIELKGSEGPGEDSGDDFSKTIVFSLSDAVVDLPEPLVKFDALVEVASKSGFVLKNKVNVSSILTSAAGGEDNGSEELTEFRKGMFSVLSSCNRGISESEWKVLQLYCTLVFERM